MGRESYGLRNMCRKGHVIVEDQIVTAGAGIDAVTNHVIITVITQKKLNGLFKPSQINHYQTGP